MLPLKLVRSLVLGEAINNPLLVNQTQTQTQKHRRSQNQKTQIPLLLFMPTKDLVTDTYRLAQLARDIGMDLYPNPSLSHIIFSWPSSSPSPSATSSSSSSSTSTSTSSSTSYPYSSSSWSLPNDAVPLPFPSLASVSLSHLRCFVSLSRGFFKLVFSKSTVNPVDRIVSNWDCCSASLISRRTGGRIDSMGGFSRALAGMGWTLLKTNLSNNPSATESGGSPIFGFNSVFLFRKVDLNRVRIEQPGGDGPNNNGSGKCRIRELRLPPLDFRNAPLRILQYILLMTDDLFYLG